MNDTPMILGDRYEVGDLLGRGGMAEVHLGRDARLGRGVAIKLLRTDLARDPVFQARFKREAQSAAGLNHPAIVAVYDTGEETVTESGGATAGAGRRAGSVPLNSAMRQAEPWPPSSRGNRSMSAKVWA